MIVKGLDDKPYKLKLISKPKKNASKPHIRARFLLKKLFPNDIIYEEVRLSGSKRFNQKDLYSDFFILSKMLIIEVHGKQHYEKTFFHSSQLEFIKAQARDKRKKNWCEINNIDYIELPSEEKDEQWSARINNRE